MISPYDARKDKQNIIHCTWFTNPQDYKQDLQLVLLSGTGSPTKTSHLSEPLHMMMILSMTFPQEEGLSELSGSSSDG